MGNKNKETRELSTPPAFINWRPSPVQLPAPVVELGEDDDAVPPRIIRIEPGFNAPMDPHDWAVVNDPTAKASRMTRKMMAGPKPEMLVLESVTDIGEREVESLLKATSSLAGLQWWLNKERREPVIEELKKCIEERSDRVRVHEKARKTA